jgi:hypothetical protein
MAPKNKTTAKRASRATAARTAATKRTPSSKAGAKTSPRANGQPTGRAAARLIDQRIRELGDWRGETLGRMRALILEADPEIIEEIKWIKPTNPLGVATWSHNGIVCTGEVYKQVVKLTFAQGASIPDPSGLFNASLEGGTRRAIDIRQGEKVDARAFKSLVKAAVARNSSPAKKDARAASKTKPVKLLSGGNPQIAKADGDVPVQEYIAAMPGWKRDTGKRIDALIERTVPGVRKAVRWNSPFYGVEGRGWFLSFHVFAKYVKVTFFRGTSLKPVPPGGTPKSGETRWIDVHEGDFDETQTARWVKQAAALPGWIP